MWPFLIANNIDFKPKLIRRDREGHCINGKTHNDDTLVLKTYATQHNRAGPAGVGVGENTLRGLPLTLCYKG